MTAFFLDYLNTKVDGFAKEEDAYEVFKDVYRKGKYTNESMLKEILHYADFYHTFLYGDKKYGDKINSLLKSLQKLKQTTVFLFLFPVFDDYENEVIGLKELEKVLQFLLHYSIRRLICEIGSNSLRVYTRRSMPEYSLVRRINSITTIQLYLFSAVDFQGCTTR